MINQCPALQRSLAEGGHRWPYMDLPHTVDLPNWMANHDRLRCPDSRARWFRISWANSSGVAIRIQLLCKAPIINEAQVGPEKRNWGSKKKQLESNNSLHLETRDMMCIVIIVGHHLLATKIKHESPLGPNYLLPPAVMMLLKCKASSSPKGQHAMEQLSCFLCFELLSS